MVGRRGYARALGGVLAATVLAVGPAAHAVAAPGTAPTGTTPPAAQPPTAFTPAHTARTAPDGDALPLSISIDSITPGYLPTRGKIVVTGEVTNVSEETWTTINLYAVVGDDLDPIRTPAQLESAVATPSDEYVGNRLVDVGKTGSVERLSPGETATYRIVVPASAVTIDQPGVYWFGVHALGQSDSSPRDEVAVADGKARTFLSYVPQRLQQEPLPTAFVVPLQRDIVFADDGSLSELEQWRSALESGGRLRDTTDLVATSGSVPITYVLDPALLDAVARLSRGNPGRSLTASGPKPADGEEPTATGQPDGSSGSDPDGTEGSDASDDTDGGPVDPDELPSDVAPVARAATDWLGSFQRSLTGSEVLTLPYGNLDLTAAAAYRPEDGRGAALYELARAQRDRVLRNLDVDTTPAVTSPGGYLDSGAVALADRDATVLLTDGALRDSSPGVAEIDGHRAVVSASAFGDGGPGPSSSFSGIALRQQLLAEAAVRLLQPDPQPLVVTLPQRWNLADPSQLFTGLDVPWIDFGTVEDVLGATSPEEIDPEALVYPPSQADLQVEPATFDAVDDLIEAGDQLQNLLAENNDVGGVITEQALTALSYNLRRSQLGARASTRASTSWVSDKLGSVQISAPKGVTLSGNAGSFATTLRNDLDEPVRVTIRGRSADGGLEVKAPADPIVIRPGGRATVLLDAKATSSRVHNVTLSVTDEDGTAIGPSADLPIRSAQVSDVIWLIMGTGAGLLFLAIAVRLVRRIRTGRRADAGLRDGDAVAAT